MSAAQSYTPVEQVPPVVGEILAHRREKLTPVLEATHPSATERLLSLRDALATGRSALRRGDPRLLRLAAITVAARAIDLVEHLDADQQGDRP